MFKEQALRYKGASMGILCNQASMSKCYEHAVDIIQKVLPGSLKAIFSPQHGFSGEDQDNMIETPHSIHPFYKVPIYSLYFQQREPSPEMFDGLDILVTDLQDVGTRVYTFSTTLLSCMRLASKLGVKVLILDRPNPLAGLHIEGNILTPSLFSFVGNLPIPMRHGLTLGELASLQRSYYHLDLELEVIPMQGWERWMLYHHTGLPWFMPSPNMPWTTTTLLYPGCVLLEATNISEGRGTTRPFEIIGAPYMDPYLIKRRLDIRYQHGLVLQEYAFKPTFNKWQGRLCKGFMLHVKDPQKIRSYEFILHLLRILKEEYPEEFQWKLPPYEYEYERLPIDIVAGDTKIRQYVEGSIELEGMKVQWEKEHKTYLDWIKPYLLYR